MTNIREEDQLPSQVRHSQPSQSATPAELSKLPLAKLRQCISSPEINHQPSSWYHRFRRLSHLSKARVMDVTRQSSPLETTCLRNRFKEFKSFRLFKHVSKTASTIKAIPFCKRTSIFHFHKKKSNERNSFLNSSLRNGNHQPQTNIKPHLKPRQTSKQNTSLRNGKGGSTYELKNSFQTL
ncbi:hypothetical protein PIB30_041862 [Stylosanthes scabra]|uniref:Uncharacterized protein n=1 Tax=Stylosanthes scabra TaxID=79078 RepID=A0ABU6UEA6_9FABA|nr:hypothetical protein [Stylosanthes scabra]